MASSRDTCWLAKDAYFECVDRVEQTPSSDAKSACREQRRAMEAVCMVSWIRHFEQRRDYERVKRERMAALEEHHRRQATEPQKPGATNANERKSAGGKS
jgi:cytochrome c oxidase assembly factor 6